MSDKKKEVTRRDFVADSTKIAAAAVLLPGEFPTIVPRHVLGGPGYVAPSSKLNIAIVGVGGMGRGNAEALLSENLVAFCDVDLVSSAKAIVAGAQPSNNQPASANGVALLAAFRQANEYSDFRE